jgi:hypothetical protein
MKIREPLEVNKFKDLIKQMYNGFPNFIFFKMVEDVVKTQDIRRHLLKNKFFIKGPYRDADGNIREGYSLGINALPYANALETEELTHKMLNLTKSINRLTKCVVALTLFVAGVAILQFLFRPT